MASTEGLWQVIEICVDSLPHKVEWFEPDELRKSEAGKSAKTNEEVQRMFIVPRDLIDLFGRTEAFFARCREIAAARQCDFFKANDGSWVFRSHR